MPYEFKRHAFKDKVLNWDVCIHCGLIALKNDFTRWSIRKGCNAEDHPDYARMRAAAGCRDRR